MINTPAQGAWQPNRPPAPPRHDSTLLDMASHIAPSLVAMIRPEIMLSDANSCRQWVAEVAVEIAERIVVIVERRIPRKAHLTPC